MKIVAALAWYDEPVEFLDRLVRSLTPHVDHLVCLDGAWNGYDGGPASPREQRDVIRAAAEDTGLSWTVEVPEKTWESQAKKRAHLFSLAIDDHQADWVLVVDGDEELVRCDDQLFRTALELTSLDVVMALNINLNRFVPIKDFPQSRWPIRHMYRGLYGLTVERAHNGVRTMDGRWLHGDPLHVRLQPALDLSAILQFHHDNGNRPVDRNRKARAYRELRDRERLEAWQ